MTDDIVVEFPELQCLQRKNPLAEILHNYAIVCILRGQKELIGFHSNWTNLSRRNRDYMISLALAMDFRGVLDVLESEHASVVPIMPPLTARSPDSIIFPNHYVARLTGGTLTALHDIIVVDVVKSATLSHFKGFSSRTGLCAIIFRPVEEQYILTIPIVVVYFDPTRTNLKELVSKQSTQTRIRRTLDRILDEVFEKGEGKKGSINEFMSTSEFREYFFEVRTKDQMTMDLRDITLAFDFSF